MKRLFALILTALVLLTPPALAAPRQYIDIVDDKGGNVLDAIKRREDLERSGKRVRIRGYCRSACTIYITLPNACLGRHARVGFHAPRIPNTKIIPPFVDMMMGEYYRGGIRSKWFGGWNRSHQMNVISAREYVRLDPKTRICGERG